MAQISAANSTSVFQIKSWLGLNESPAGDTVLKMGEAAVMRNFRITREGHLQIRPGYAPVCTCVEGSPVRGLWSGYVNGKFHFLAACGGQLWKLDLQEGTCTSVGEIPDAPTNFFGFAQKVYILTGAGYHCWDGENDVAEVEGYIPIVSTAVPPEGGGTLLERANLLTGKKRAKFSPDGTATTFQLPEIGVSEIVAVEGTDLAWEANTSAGTVTFVSAPSEGVNTITITWSKSSAGRRRVERMTFAETYNGSADTRVFLYGDGTNEAIYSDLDENGLASAEYFPEMNNMAVDSANTPITAMIRHYDRLLVYKTDSTFCVQDGNLTLDTGEVTAAFSVIAVNRNVGNVAPGQVKLVDNSPVSLFGRGVYRWNLSSAGSRDERNAKYIGERVGSTLDRFGFSLCRTFDDEGARELYVMYADEAVIYNYGNDTWYYYNDFPARRMASVDGAVYFGTDDGRIMHLARSYRSDDGREIDAYWESGAMDFGADWRRKYSANIWVTVKPEKRSRILVTAQSDRKSDYAAKEIVYSFSTLGNVNFAKWSFNTNRKPKVARIKLKVKKFAYYKLVFSSVSDEASATVLGADFQIRYTGNVK